MTVALIARVVLTLLLALLVALLGRMAARAARQPEVLGEIAAGLLIGPLIVLIAGRVGLTQVFPPDVLGALRFLGQLGLVLFLAQVAHELRATVDRAQFRSIGWVAAGSLLPALLAGVLFAGLINWMRDPALRGSAPAPAFVLFLGVALAVTAVPVLARILTERGLLSSMPGSLSMAAAVAIDALNWPILALAIGLATGRKSSAAVALGVLVVGVGASWLLRRELSRRVPLWFGARFPLAAAVVLGALVLGAAQVTERLGLTTIFGAFLVGLAIPRDGAVSEWAPAVRYLSRVGSMLVPVFFLVSGVTVFAAPLGAMLWAVIPVVIALAVLGKVGGGYLGARLAGYPGPVGWRIGVLMNTRGLTEIIALQAGFAVGILPPALYLACLVMALVTTALTGPLLTLLDRRESRAVSQTSGPRIAA